VHVGDAPVGTKAERPEADGHEVAPAQPRHRTQLDGLHRIGAFEGERRNRLPLGNRLPRRVGVAPRCEADRCRRDLARHPAQIAFVDRRDFDARSCGTWNRDRSDTLVQHREAGFAAGAEIRDAHPGGCDLGLGCDEQQLAAGIGLGQDLHPGFGSTCRDGAAEKRHEGNS
jgi:hypothetical protein